MTKDYIAYVRLTQAQKAELDTICVALPGNQSDHIRAAIGAYNARILPTLAHLPSADPAAAVPAEAEVTLREVGQ